MERVARVRQRQMILAVLCCHGTSASQLASAVNLDQSSQYFKTLSALHRCIRHIRPTNTAGHYILPLWFLSFFSPILTSRRLDVYHTVLPHMMWPECEFRMQVWMHAAGWKHRTQKFAVWAPSHNFVGLYLRNLECGPMPNVKVALPDIGGALCSASQSLADAHYLTAVQ